MADNQQQQAAAATSSSNEQHQQQAAAATSSSSQQQVQAAGVSSSSSSKQQQQQQAAAAPPASSSSSSSEQQQQRRQACGSMSVTLGSRFSGCQACEQNPATSVLLVNIQAPQSGRLSLVQLYILSKAVEHRWFLCTSGLSSVLKELLLERNAKLSCNQKKKKKKKTKHR